MTSLFGARRPGRGGVDRSFGRAGGDRGASDSVRGFASGRRSFPG